MTNAEYWEKRRLQLQDNLMKTADEFILELEEAYRHAYFSMEEDISLFYLRFAKNEGMTLLEAKKMLTGPERKRFQMNIEAYIQKGMENGVSADWMKELESASDLYHISRLRALQMQLFQQIELLEAYKENGLKKTLKEIYQEGYYHSIFDYQQFTEIGTSFTKLDTPLINQVLAKPWTYDGETFSTRIWKDKEALKHSLDKILTQGLIRGESSNKIAKKIAKETNVSLSSANRLVVTESAAFSTRASMDSFREMEMEEVQYLAALDEKTCVECGTMDGGHFPRKEGKIGTNLPPLHPHCRCVVIPYFSEDFTANEQRIARDENGNAYHVPANMTYQEWKESYVTSKVLTEEETGAIIKYIGSESYILNEKLRNGLSLTKREKAWVDNLDSALRKMPRYEGNLVRYVDIPNDEEIREYLTQFKIGGIYKPGHYMSTTKGEVYNKDAKIRLYIENASKGRDISTINVAEKEVLYERNSEFKVINAVENNGIHYILLEEI